jgi:uncharacterized protein (DUF1499 family)
MVMDENQTVDTGEAGVTTPAVAARRDVGGTLVLALAVTAVVAAFAGALGSGWGLWEFGPALRVVFFAGVASILAVLIALGTILWRRRYPTSGPWKRLAPGLVLATLFSLYFLRFLWLSMSLPAIHDVSTDLADPPLFVALPLRADNDVAIPGAEDSAMRGMSPRQRWQALHQENYGDVRSLRVAAPVAQTMTRIEAVIAERGWEIASIDRTTGRIEATDTSLFFRFKDDIVFRVRPASSSLDSSIVDMRSVSRVGQHDFGVNANRVRAFLADIPASQPQAR